MGEFTQNLLKLTEFPFSYSLMGLLALIFGQGINLEELSFAKIGPLLILMGFVATTLSICDPIGVLQRVILLGQFYVGSLYAAQRPIHEERLAQLLDMRIFGRSVRRQFLILPYIIAIRHRPEHIESVGIVIGYVKIDQRLMKIWRSALYMWKNEMYIDYDSYELERMHDLPTDSVRGLLEGLRRKTVKTKWVTAEIDRITALVYFIIVISVFIVAILLLPELLIKFSQVFEDNELVRSGILIFSFLALAAISGMFVIRIRDLRNKARIVFNYLTVLEAVKVEVEKFKSNFSETESYLNGNDWALADYWVKRTQIEYMEVYLDNLDKMIADTSQSKS